MKVQTDYFVSETVVIITEHLSFQMIAAFFTLSESLDFKKKNVERELAFSEKIMSSFLLTVLVFLMKNSFLTDSSAFHRLIFSVISMIQISAFSKILLSDFLKFLFLISTLSSSFNAVLTDLLILLVDQNMCLHCSKQLIEDSEICCSHLNEY